jgi:hypothetical protein
MGAAIIMRTATATIASFMSTRRSIFRPGWPLAVLTLKPVIRILDMSVRPLRASRAPKTCECSTSRALGRTPAHVLPSGAASGDLVSLPSPFLLRPTTEAGVLRWMIQRCYLTKLSRMNNTLKIQKQDLVRVQDYTSPWVLIERLLVCGPTSPVRKVEGHPLFPVTLVGAP